MQISLVTGGNSGIGYEIVRQLASQGMVVYLGARDFAKGLVAASELSSWGDVRPLHLDLAANDTLISAIATIEKEHGRLDLLVNNAGVALRGETAESIATVFNTNLHGPINLTLQCIKLLRHSQAGRVINVSSGAGRFSFLASDALKLTADNFYYAYPLSKTALNAATVMLARMLEPENITVNACCPGRVATKLSGMQGKSTAEGAAIIVAVAELSMTGATGQLFDETGPVSW